jgi:hypothetical protein
MGGLHDWFFAADASGGYWICTKCGHRPDGFNVDPPCSAAPVIEDDNRCMKCDRVLCHELDAYWGTDAFERFLCTPCRLGRR